MLIRFQGANRTVTGSSHLVEAGPGGRVRVLLDFGMYQGRRDEAREVNTTVPDSLRDRLGDLTAVVLSHGHLDHCGRLPMLYRWGYRGPIYCTPATADVARVVMLDAARIQEEDAAYLNRRSIEARGRPVSPLFTEADVAGVLKLFKHAGYGQTTDLGHGVRFTFHDAGHVLGSAYVLLSADEQGATRTLLFTADVGRYGTPIIRDPAPLPGPVDAVITESTYGTIRHAPMSEVGPQLLAILRDAIARKGRVILPSFAVGRTQTMLWYVQRFIQAGQIPEVPIFVDSPMGSEISRITHHHAELYDQETRDAVCDDEKCEIFGYSRVTFAVTSEESRRINNVHGAAVIIASSPTCEFGRVLHHLKRSVENPDDTIVFVGWTPPHTLGRRLQQGGRESFSTPATPTAMPKRLPTPFSGDGGHSEERGRESFSGQRQGGGRGQVRILDRYYDLRCRVETLHGLSAHADGDELLRFLGPTLGPRTTAFVVHGEADRCDGFAARLSAAGMGAAVAPAWGTCSVVGEAEIDGPVDTVASDE